MEELMFDNEDNYYISQAMRKSIYKVCLAACKDEDKGIPINAEALAKKIVLIITNPR